MASALAPGHTSSSDAALYGVLHPLPPALHDAHLAIDDHGAFTDIAAFFDRLAPRKPAVPGLDLVAVPASITRAQLQGDRFDHQGIDWLARSTTRSHVRAKRAEFEAARLARRLHHVRSDFHANISPLPNSDSFFRFKRNNTLHRAFFPHFQLRNVLAATSRNDVYYASGHHVVRTDAEDGQKDVVVDFSSRLSIKGSITTIASAANVLVAGAFDGEYAITDLSATHDAAPTFGRTFDLMVETRSRIVNHMHLFDGRATYHPQAVLCSNDHHLRILDCATNKFTHTFQYPAAVNCSATSPNGRMRVVVGDFQETLITNAETGQTFEMLNSHTDDAFACAWADDGIHVATAAQDSTISVWDARSWGKPLTSFTSELGITRSLRFSPVGSGPRVLVAAEADDYISVINAQTFESKQVFDLFGPIGGITFTPDGQSLFIANGEKTFGGIVELDRTGWAERTAERKPKQDIIWDDLMTDWTEDDRLDAHGWTLSGDVERERRCVDFGDMVV
ncbi:WD40-repeat-containing domain protein [Ampelomyces quisqualis]|uniref:WD40-repeat-containing domain protein n=1 Tax=Ampelomyces quisqualis TaxID=50730 RepID=A0A6A5QC39_AMPQU|nr:WD40-repeat-containing domain protein [Ampelomyces quisqualis]